MGKNEGEWIGNEQVEIWTRKKFLAVAIWCCVCVCVCVCVHVYVCASGSAVLAGCNYLKCKYSDALVVVANGL